MLGRIECHVRLSTPSQGPECRETEGFAPVVRLSNVDRGQGLGLRAVGRGILIVATLLCEQTVLSRSVRNDSIVRSTFIHLCMLPLCAT
jgi:hypothetical protein